MDLMSLRRNMMGVIAGMEGGINIIKGTITPQNTNLLTVDIGKTLQRYILFIEMTDESITMLENAEVTQNKAFSLLVLYGYKNIGELQTGYSSLNARYNGSSIGFANANSFTLTGSSFSASPVAISQNSANTLYVGYTYNYYVIPMN